MKTMIIPERATADGGRELFAELHLEQLQKGPTGNLVPQRLKKPARRELIPISLERKLAKMGATLGRSFDAFERVDDTFNAAGIRADSVHAFAKILGAGAMRAIGVPSTFSAGLAKGLPPESNNAENDDVRADDGAQLAHDNIEQERQQAGVRQRATPYTGPASAPHAASMRAMQALRTQNDGGNDPTVEAVKVAQRSPIPLTPGSLGGFAQDPNRADAF
jgi:hypothetical protein